LAERIGVSDILQDTYVKVLDKFSTFRGGGTKKRFRRWMTVVACNTAIDKLTRRNRETPLPESLDAAQVAADDVGSLGTLFAKWETEAEIVDAILGLPKEDQTLVWMRVVEGCSHEVIARTLDIKPATSRKRFERILTSLRKKLGGGL
jgi:RNA polymerase sigma factor (sigma-70 family)